MIKHLQRAGFKKAGVLTLHHRALGLMVQKPLLERQVLYALVVDDHDVVFIGRSSCGLERPLLHEGFKAWQKEARLALRNGRTIEVYSMSDPGNLWMRGFALNLPAGLEDSMIRELRPPWNETEPDFSPHIQAFSRFTSN